LLFVDEEVVEIVAELDVSIVLDPSLGILVVAMPVGPTNMPDSPTSISVGSSNTIEEELGSVVVDLDVVLVIIVTGTI
jgi:hypothetical protein